MTLITDPAFNGPGTPEKPSAALNTPTLEIDLAARVVALSTVDGAADEITEDATLEPITLGTRVANLIGITVPFAGLIVAIAMLWGWGFSWIHGVLLASLYLVTALGITVGYHRYFTHKSFETPRWMQAIFAILGGMAFEGAVLTWVANHRLHHQHSDRPGDPHSPHEHGEGVMGVVKGFWHAHIGWIFRATDPGNMAKYVPDLAKDRMLRTIGSLWSVWAIAGLILPAVIAGLVTGTWSGAFLGFLWGGLVRVFLVHHVTWSVNSVCHIWGSRPFRSADESRNNPIFGLLAMGEGWHNNHHAFPASARHGLRWWEFDISYWTIRAMKLVGLAWDVNVPSQKRMMAKMA